MRILKVLTLAALFTGNFAAEASANSCTRDGEPCVVTLTRVDYPGEAKKVTLRGICDAVYKLRPGESREDADRRGPDFLQCTPLDRR